ncbi:MAG: hypothetical protein ABI706_16925 [Ilumatobacteraceae bacterium]
MSSFVPSVDDLAAVARLLARRRLVTITGPGGVGKTRLPIEAGRSLHVPADGIWFVPLETVTSTDPVLDAVSTVLEVVGADARRSLADRLLDSDLVLVLDNCEHLDDEFAAMVGELLERAPRVRCFATSQRPLGIPGEAQWPLGPLNRPQAVSCSSNEHVCDTAHVLRRRRTCQVVPIDGSSVTSTTDSVVVDVASAAGATVDDLTA